MRGDPHKLIEGALVVGFSMRAKAAYIYVRGEFWHETNCVQRAVDEVTLLRLRPTRKVSLAKTLAARDTTSMSTCTAELAHTSVEKRLG